MKFCFWGNIAKGYIGKPIGGGEKQLFYVSFGLSQKGHDIVIVDFSIEEDKVIDGVSLYSLKRYAERTNKNKYVALYQLLNEINADVYYSRIRSSIHLIGLFVSRKLKKKFIYHSAHDLDSATFKERLKGFYLLTSSLKKIILHIIHSEILFPILLLGSDVIIAQNTDQLQRFKSKYPKKKIVLVNNIFESKNQLQQNEAVKKYDFIVVSSLDLRKGVKDLKILIDELPEKKFLILGRPRDKNGQKFVWEIDKYENVEYRQSVPQIEVLSSLKISKFLISTSKGEGFPNVFLEAWSTGTPVLSLNINPSEVITDFNLGKYFKGDLSKMKDNMKISNSDSFNPTTISSYVRDYHNSEYIIDKIEEVVKIN